MPLGPWHRLIQPKQSWAHTEAFLGPPPWSSPSVYSNAWGSLGTARSEDTCLGNGELMGGLSVGLRMWESLAQT